MGYKRRNKKDRYPKQRHSRLSKFFGAIKRFYSRFFKRNKVIKRTVGFVEQNNQNYSLIVFKNNDSNSVYVNGKDMLSAMNGDKVLIDVYFKKTEDGKHIGKIIKVLDRKYKFFVGTLKNDGKNNFYLDTKEKHIYNKIVVERKSIPRNTVINSRVKVDILRYPDKRINGDFLCRVVDVFGCVGEHESEMKLILNNYSLQSSFPQKVIDEANNININIDEEVKHRRDFRDVFTVTIDPVKAKDFDDAISFKQLDKDKYELGIHIADVSHFVKEKTAMNAEAYKRNTSVYLIDRVIPMLPERLCNDLCSLVENENRLTMSIVFEINSNGDISKEWIGETIIRSDKRMTYEEAQKSITDNEDSLHDNLSKMYTISKALRKKRFDKGAINFNFDDIDFSVDENNILKITKTECQESHNMIEEFMLLANEHVANYVFKLGKNKNKKRPAFIYRIHESPQMDKINEFCTLMRNFKFKIDNDIKTFPKQLNNLFEEIKGKENEQIILTLAIRTMKRAKYTTKPSPHFGLAFEHYTHYTSPIRRFVDILVHRLLKKYLKGNYEFDINKYENMCTYANELETVAMDAERDSIKFKQVCFLKDHVGTKYSGIVTGITDFGMFVEIEGVYCDGFLRFSECKYDYFYYDKTHLRAIGKYTNNIYSLGDSINVVIKSCNVEKSLVDFSFV